jgi:hypothetical protein
MKKILLACALSFGVAAVAQAQAPTQTDAKAPKFKFDEEVHDFGTIKESPTPAEYVFKFKNVGKAPLIIQNASASCGCTTPEWPKEPILPGKTGKIVVKYNTQGRVAPFEKSVYIQSNAPAKAGQGDRYELKIKGTVVAPTASK